MTNEELLWLTELACDCISKEDFMSFYPERFGSDPHHGMRLLREALEKNDMEETDLVMGMLALSLDRTAYVDLLNDMLVDPTHRQHQYVAKQLQELADARSVPFVRHVLECKFSYLAYTGSESGAIARWFSWLLFSIGTEEAVALMREYADSEDEGIREEMKYRLKKMSYRAM